MRRVVWVAAGGVLALVGHAGPAAAQYEAAPPPPAPGYGVPVLPPANYGPGPWLQGRVIR